MSRMIEIDGKQVDLELIWQHALDCLERQEPWAICFFQEQVRELEQLAVVQPDGSVVYVLDSRPDDEVVIPFARPA